MLHPALSRSQQPLGAVRIAAIFVLMIEMLGFLYMALIALVLGGLNWISPHPDYSFTVQVLVTYAATVALGVAMIARLVTRRRLWSGPGLILGVLWSGLAVGVAIVWYPDFTRLGLVGLFASALVLVIAVRERMSPTKAN